MVMLTIELLLNAGHCRFDLGSGAAFIRSEFATTINTVHIVNARNVKMNNCSYHFYFLLFRMGQTGQLSVDNRPSVQGTSPGQATRLNFYSYGWNLKSRDLIKNHGIDIESHRLISSRILESYLQFHL